MVKLKKRTLELAAKDAIPVLEDYSFRHAKKGEQPWQISIQLRMTTERTADPEEGQKADPNKVRRAVGLTMVLKSLSTKGKDNHRYGVDVLESAVVQRSEPFENLAAQAIRKAFDRTRAAIELENASDEVLIEKLSSPEEKLRARAVSMAGERKLKTAVPRLTKMLADEKESEDIVLSVIGALVQIGDPSAAGALIDAGRNRSPLYLTQIIFALAQLGGREAQAYLFTVASGHPDPQIKASAKQALEELERRMRKEVKE